MALIFYPSSWIQVKESTVLPQIPLGTCRGLLFGLLRDAAYIYPHPSQDVTPAIALTPTEERSTVLISAKDIWRIQTQQSDSSLRTSLDKLQWSKWLSTSLIYPFPCSKYLRVFSTPHLFQNTQLWPTIVCTPISAFSCTQWLSLL